MTHRLVMRPSCQYKSVLRATISSMHTYKRSQAASTCPYKDPMEVGAGPGWLRSSSPCQSWVAGKGNNSQSQLGILGIGGTFIDVEEAAGPCHSFFRNARAESEGGMFAVGGGGRGQRVSASRGGGMEGQGREGEWFQLTDSCLLAINRGDITKWSIDGNTDAIVNAANERMLGGGGVDGAIHRAAGVELYEACREKPEVKKNVRCPVGNAVITRGFDLPASHVIHTVGPIYEDEDTSADLLSQAYKSSMAVAVEEGIEYIAFPAISCGVFGYPVSEAANVAVQTLQECPVGLREVHFVLFNDEAQTAWVSAAEALLHRAAL